MTTWILDMALVALSLSMFLFGHYGTTRQLAIAPLVAAALDVAFAGQIDPSLTPVLSALLIALQGALLLAGGLVLYQDRVRLRNRQARRRRRQQLVRSRLAFEQAASRPSRREQEVCA